MTSFIDVAIDQQGIEPIKMEDDMMSEYYNTTTSNAQNDDHSMMMMMEEAEQESSNLIADTILNDDEIASVSNEVLMEEDGNNDIKLHENDSFASTSYPNPSIPADVEIEHSIGVDLPDETIGDAVYEVEESEHVPSVNAIVAEEEETEEKGNTAFDQTERSEAGQIAKDSEEIAVPEPEHGTLDSNDEYATEGHLSESMDDGKVKLSEKSEITEEPVNNNTDEPLVVKEKHINTQDEATDEGQGAHISTSSVGIEQNAEKDVEHHHSSAQLNPIRVTFDGQDFVLYPDEEPSTFISLNHERVQAPTLSVEAKVFSEPLETLFEALRIREALGDFLDEGTELCLTFHDLDMIAREDDIYIREVTLDDIQRLHSGLGYTSSMHINVSESQRFISRYNDLANQVSVLIEQKTENESIEQSKRNGEQSIEASGGDAGLEIVDGDITASSKEEAVGEPTTEVEAERKEEGEEEEVDQDEEDTFVTVTNDEENDEEQYVESYEDGGEMHNQLKGEEDVEENEEEEHHPRQLHFFSIRVAPAETNGDPASVQEEPKSETKTEEETYNEQLTEKVEGGNEESTMQEKDSSRDTGTTLSGNGEEAEKQADDDYEPAEEVDALNEEEGAEEDYQGIEEAYEDYEEEEGGQEEPFDDEKREEENVEEAEADEVYDNENDFEPQVSSHGQKRQFEDDLEYSTEDLNGEGIDDLEHNEDDSKRARYEEPEKEEA